MKAITTVLFFGLVVLSGCETVSVSSKFGGDKDSTGLAYATAIKVLSVEVNYVTKEKKQFLYGVEMEQNAQPEVVIVQASVKSVLLPDPHNVFVADVEEAVDAAFIDATIKYEVSADGLLLVANTDLTDKAGEVVKEVAGTALTVGKLAAMAKARAELPEDLKPLGNRIKAIYAELQDAKVTAERRAQLMQEVKDLYAFIASYMENNKEEWTVSETKSVRFSASYDFSDFNDVKDSDGKVIYCEKEYELKGLVEGVKSVTVFPKVCLRLYLSSNERQNAERMYEGTAGGFVYRIPHPVRVQVIVKNLNAVEFCSYDEYIGIPQLSPFYVIPSRSKAWTKRNTELKFDPNNGSLIYFCSSSGSSAEAVSKAAKETVSEIDNKLSEIRNASRDYEKAALESKTELLGAELKYQQAQKALSDYKKQMEGASE